MTFIKLIEVKCPKCNERNYDVLNERPFKRSFSVPIPYEKEFKCKCCLTIWKQYSEKLMSITVS